MALSTAYWGYYANGDSGYQIFTIYFLLHIHSDNPDGSYWAGFAYDSLRMTQEWRTYVNREQLLMRIASLANPAILLVFSR